jgi:hypothetical protein
MIPEENFINNAKLKKDAEGKTTNAPGILRPNADGQASIADELLPRMKDKALPRRRNECPEALLG